MKKLNAIRGILIVALLFLGQAFSGDEKPLYHFPELYYFPEMPKPSEPVTVAGVELGRFLFYDPELSIDSSMSCASCHKQMYAFSDSPNRFSNGRNGESLKRNTLPLFNLAWYPSMFWDGLAGSIEEQVFHPVRNSNEMNLQWNSVADRLKKNKFYSHLFKKAYGEAAIDSVHIANAIAQFLRTLLSYRSKYDSAIAMKVQFTSDEYDGLVLMNDQTKGDCLHCHTTDANGLGTRANFSNNGLDTFANAKDYNDKGRGDVTGNASDNGKFMIPSLRNLSFTAPYMHDGRFKTLEEVLNFYSEGVHNCGNIDAKMQYAYRGGVALTVAEKKKIISFLRTMDDSAFITESQFSNPWK